MATKTKEPETKIIKNTVTAIVNVAKFQRLFIEAKQRTDEGFAHSVKDADGSNLASNMMSNIKLVRKDIEDERKNTLEEPKKFTDKLNAITKPQIKMCDECVQHLANEMRAFKAAEDARCAKKLETAHKISVAKGGDGSHIQEPTRKRTIEKSRSVPDYDKIKLAVEQSTKNLKIKPPIEIAGVEIYPIWKFKVYDAPAVPKDFRKDSFVR